MRAQRKTQQIGEAEVGGQERESVSDAVREHFVVGPSAEPDVSNVISGRACGA